MSNKPRLFRETTLKSTLKCMMEAGLTVTGAEIGPDGSVRVLTGPVAPIIVEEPNPFDEPARGQA